MPPKNPWDNSFVAGDKTSTTQLPGQGGTPPFTGGGMPGMGGTPPFVPNSGSSGLPGLGSTPPFVPGGAGGSGLPGGVGTPPFVGGTGGFAGGSGLGGGAPSPIISMAAASASTVPNTAGAECADAPPKAGKKSLDEIKKLVAENNNSDMDDEYVICQIYQESGFDPNIKPKNSGKDGAKGLMQVQRKAVKQVYSERKKKNLGGKISDAQKKVAFDEGSKVYDESIYDESTNIQLGTEYLQYWIDKEGTVEKGYQGYRGPEQPDYYEKIQKCAQGLKKNPDSMQPLKDMKGEK